MVYCANCQNHKPCQKSYERYMDLVEETNFSSEIESILYRQMKLSEMTSQCLGYGS